MRNAARRRWATAVGACVLLPVAVSSGTQPAISAPSSSAAAGTDVVVPVDVDPVPHVSNVPASSGSIGTLVATSRRAGQTRAAFNYVPGIPVPALRAYRRAAATMQRVDASCNLPWQALAGIGRIESDHGRFAGASIDSEGVSTPRIVGIALDGTAGFAAIRDTDQGRLDGDRRWDRAVGPMQFIPSTWEQVGADGDGDGRADPNDLDDAALGAARYLCAGDADLSDGDGLAQAVLRYNHSLAYVRLVLAAARGYEGGVRAVPVTGVGSGPLPTFLPSLAVDDVRGDAGNQEAGRGERSRASQRHERALERRSGAGERSDRADRANRSQSDGASTRGGSTGRDPHRDRKADQPGGQGTRPKDDPKPPPAEDPKDDPKDEPKAEPVPPPDGNPKDDPKPPGDDPKPPPDDDPKPPPDDDPKPPPDDDPKPPPDDDPKPPPDDDPKPPPDDDPKPPPDDDPKPPPDDDPKPPPDDDPAPEDSLTELSGTLQLCRDTGWCLDDNGLDVGDIDTLGDVEAAADYDGDGKAESVAAELDGLDGLPVTLQVVAPAGDGTGGAEDQPADGPLVVVTINGLPYRGEGGSLPAPPG